jgi:MFS transporter, DHA1 family, multidrug resistance protein
MPVWRRNIYAVTAASFLGFTGFTLVMPFLPLFIAQLGVSDVGQVAMWTGVSLGVTPGLTALLAPAWGRLGDRYGRKIMVERSLASFVIVMAAMAYVTRAWHVLALRAVQGLFAGYGSLSVAMAAESAPRDEMPQAIGLVQTAQRIGPAIGPVLGGILAGLVGLRGGFLATAGFYAIGLVVVHVMYDDAAVSRVGAEEDGVGDARSTGRVSFRSVLAFQNFMLMMAVIFGLQFVDRSFGPVLPLYVEQSGTSRASVPLVSGLLFSVMACTGALGHHFCGRLMRRYATRIIIAGGSAVAAASCGLIGVSGNLVLMTVASATFGLGIGAAMTASYSAAGAVIPAGAHGAGFGVLTSASLVGMASSPFIAGLLSVRSIRVVFLVDLAVMGTLSFIVHRSMRSDPKEAAPA